VTTDLVVRPIGFVRSVYHRKYEAPRQPGVDERQDVARIELIDTIDAEQCVRDLMSFSHIWIISWFDRVTTWKPMVLPPRSEKKRGVFATRSPHRPNPIGLSVARLVDIHGRTIQIDNTDLLDGTPVLDVKPYVPYADMVTGASNGWLADIEEKVVFHVNTMAIRHRHFVTDELIAHIERTLSLDPNPHPYRRVSERLDGRRELAVRQYRFVFEVNDTQVNVIDAYLADGSLTA